MGLEYGVDPDKKSYKHNGVFNYLKELQVGGGAGAVCWRWRWRVMGLEYGVDPDKKSNKHNAVFNYLNDVRFSSLPVPPWF